MLTIETYSGQLFDRSTIHKTSGRVFAAIQAIEARAQLKYGPPVVIRQHDNEKAAIAVHVNGETQDVREAREKGQTLEIPPADTHGPTGRIERAGQEVITKPFQ